MLGLNHGSEARITIAGFMSDTGASPNKERHTCVRRLNKCNSLLLGQVSSGSSDPCSLSEYDPRSANAQRARHTSLASDNRLDDNINLE